VSEDVIRAASDGRPYPTTSEERTVFSGPSELISYKNTKKNSVLKYVNRTSPRWHSRFQPQDTDVFRTDVP